MLKSTFKIHMFNYENRYDITMSEMVRIRMEIVVIVRSIDLLNLRSSKLDNATIESK